MKRTAFLFIIVLSIISCKETNSGDSPTIDVSTTLPGLGGSPATAAYVVGAFNMVVIDTSFLRTCYLPYAKTLYKKSIVGTGGIECSPCFRSAIKSPYIYKLALSPSLDNRMSL